MSMSLGAIELGPWGPPLDEARARSHTHTHEHMYTRMYRLLYRPCRVRLLCLCPCPCLCLCLSVLIPTCVCVCVCVCHGLRVGVCVHVTRARRRRTATCRTHELRRTIVHLRTRKGKDSLQCTCETRKRTCWGTCWSGGVGVGWGGVAEEAHMDTAQDVLAGGGIGWGEKVGRSRTLMQGTWLKEGAIAAAQWYGHRLLSKSTAQVTSAGECARHWCNQSPTRSWDQEKGHGRTW